jgi:hypothetical protein
VLIVLILTVLIIAVALAVVLVVVCLGMRREHVRFLSNAAPTRTAGAARAISGLYVHMPERDTRIDDGTTRLSMPPSRSKSFVA